MTYEEAKTAKDNRKMVMHTESSQIAGYIRCFDNDRTGAYLDYHYVFVPLEKLMLFDVRRYLS